MSLAGLVLVLAVILGLVLLLESTAGGARPKESKVQVLARGVMATHGQHRWVTWARAERWAAEAIEITQLPQHSWMQPVDLLAVAAHESDFRTYRIAEGGKSDPLGWDCGITQVRTTVFEGGKTRRARKLCTRLARSSFLGFKYAARELSGYRQRYCKKWLHKGKPWKLKRCTLNVYNQGPRYCRAGHCGRYWLRVHCFRLGILLARKPRLRGKRVSCRRAQSLRWIWKVYR